MVSVRPPGRDGRRAAARPCRDRDRNRDTGTFRGRGAALREARDPRAPPRNRSTRKPPSKTSPVRRDLSPSQVAFLGDDANDLPALARAGFAGCPADAFDPVRDACHYVCRAPGGHGAFREFAEVRPPRRPTRVPASLTWDHERSPLMEFVPRNPKRQVAVRDREVGDGFKVFVVAEIGINHNGSLDIARQLIDGAALRWLRRREVPEADAGALRPARPVEHRARHAVGPDDVSRIPAPGRVRPARVRGDRPRTAARPEIALVRVAAGTSRRSTSSSSSTRPCYKAASASLTDHAPPPEDERPPAKPLMISTGMSTADEIERRRRGRRASRTSSSRTRRRRTRARPSS